VFRESVVSDRLRLAVGGFAFVLLGGFAWLSLIAPEQAGVGTLIDPAFVLIALAMTGFLGFGYVLGERLQDEGEQSVATRAGRERAGAKLLPLYVRRMYK
jgi:hypothetical protein